MSNYTPWEKQLLLKMVDEVIRFGLEQGKLLTIKLEEYPEKFRLNGASFITLEINRNLRGCIGSLRAYQPLIKDVIQNSYAAAFNDSRFAPLTIVEYPKVTKQISILSKPEPIDFDSEEDLLKKIKPGIDGLILSERNRHSTFLPAVWKSLPEPKQFLEHLKLKVGLSKDYWSSTIKIERYRVEVLG